MNRAGAAGLVVAAAGWGSLAVTTDVALRGFGPLTVLFGELAVAASLLVGAALLTGRRLPQWSPGLLAVGILEPGIAYLAFDFGVQRTSTTHAGLLIGMETMFVVALGVIVLRERPRAGTVTGLALAVAGVAVLGWHPDGRAGLAGDALILLDAVAGAAAVVLTVRLVRDVDPLTLTAVQFATGLAVVTPVCVAAWTSGAEPLPGRVSAGPVVALLLSGCVGTAGAFLVYTWALARVSATSAGAAATLIPLFALGFTVLGGQPLTRVAVLAAVLVVLGLLAHVRAERRPLSVSWQVGLLVVGGPGAGPLSSACRVASTAPG